MNANPTFDQVKVLFERSR